MSSPPDAATPLTHFEQLLLPFYEAEKPAEAWKIGTEAEKFGVDASTGAPLAYAGEHGVLRVLEHLVEHHGWHPHREVEGGPIISLERGQASITLEPGAQLELSGAPLPDVHAVRAELEAHLAELTAISRTMNLAWLGVGFHPLATQAELPWVPKLRYGIMREYLPTRGAGGLDMMRRTATVQANFDYSSEADAMTKLLLGLRIAPLVNAMFANAPFIEGRVSGSKTLRGEVWLNMDPSRSGLIAPLLRHPNPGYAEYVEWALDAGMFLLLRGERVVANTGQTFRRFLAEGFEGERATLADWRLHLQTLFPDVRLKRTLEVRMCDALPQRLAPAVAAFFAGLYYDADALAAAAAFARRIEVDELVRAQPALTRQGLAARVGGASAQALCRELLGYAEAGLARRARRDASGRDERVYLAELRELLEAGRVPADVLTDGLGEGPIPTGELVRRTRL